MQPFLSDVRDLRVYQIPEEEVIACAVLMPKLRSLIYGEPSKTKGVREREGRESGKRKNGLREREKKEERSEEREEER
jgi:hypothetical protein